MHMDCIPNTFYIVYERGFFPRGNETTSGKKPPADFQQNSRKKCDIHQILVNLLEFLELRNFQGIIRNFMIFNEIPPPA